MKGMELFRLFSPGGNVQARKVFEECIALDPGYPGPYVMLAWTHLTAVYNGWSKSPEESITQALELAQRAIVLDSSQADAFSLLGNIYLLTRQYEKAITEGERAVALNPNGADSHVWLAMILTSSGKPEDAIELIYKAIRLNPFPPNWYFLSLGNAFFLMGEYNQAVEAYKKALQRSPNFLLVYIGLAASCSAANLAEDARAAASQILRIDPKFSLEAFSGGLPYKNEKHKEFWIDTLRKAGLK
jgi:adenylate cyclase